MQLFLTLNDYAGRWPALDAFMRGVYIGTIPLLAVLLLGLLILAPRARRAPSRGSIALATLLALGGAALLAWGIEAWAQSADLGTLSPRPFMTRWVNLLIVEPQDNSFPCVEIIVATILATGIWVAHRGWGVFAIFATLLLMTARLFCGTNYLADVGVGAITGLGLMLLCLALSRAPQTRKGGFALASTGVFTLAGTALATFIVMAAMPRFAGKLQLPWGIAPPTDVQIAANGSRAARSTLQEGEGVPTLGMRPNGTINADEYAGEAEAQAMTKRASLFLPAAEKKLRAVLTPKALPFVLLDVEVAPVNFKDKSYRAAAIRFEIDTSVPRVRNVVAQRAAGLVKAAFAADPQLDNVDITGVVTGDAAQLDNSLMRFAGDEVPVFTASIQRKNLIVSAPKWANNPGLEGGLWLRTRSRLWVNDRVLPKLAELPKPTPKPTASPNATALPNATASPNATPLPNATALPKPTASPNATPLPTAPRIPVARPTVGPTKRPLARPTRRPAPRPTKRPTVRRIRRTPERTEAVPATNRRAAETTRPRRRPRTERLQNR